MVRIDGMDARKRRRAKCKAARTDKVFFFFCLKRLSRHYLPPVADYREKDEREVRKSHTVQKG